MTRVRTTASRGNVFRDLGFPEPEAENLRIRSELMMHVTKTIRRRGWTQAEAAKCMRVTQPRISDLVRGRIDRFSVDALIELCARCGLSVRCSVRAKRVA
jgi:predicted XRE-type DNA-binding protein